MSTIAGVMYHYVRKVNLSRYKNIKSLDESLFIEQIRYLKRNYTIVSILELIDCLYNNVELPNNSIVLTFDDGYLEHFTRVYPILKKESISGAFYVPAKTTLEKKVLDVNKIHHILSESKDVDRLLIRLKELFEEYKTAFNVDEFDDYYQRFANQGKYDPPNVVFFKRLLQHGLPRALREKITSQLFSEVLNVDEATLASELYMSMDQLIHLANDGMHIGAHGYDHYWWNKLNQFDLEIEIDKSIEFLNSINGQAKCWTACYPYGGYSENVVELLSQKGCKLAFTTDRGTFQNHNFLTLPRFDTNDFPPISNLYKEYSK